MCRVILQAEHWRSCFQKKILLTVSPSATSAQSPEMILTNESINATTENVNFRKVKDGADSDTGLTKGDETSTPFRSGAPEALLGRSWRDPTELDVMRYACLLPKHSVLGAISVCV
eukprot:SAG31_NODE_1347_length_8693_cov_32.744938_5_plen_116_part_00